MYLPLQLLCDPMLWVDDLVLDTVPMIVFLKVATHNISQKHNLKSLIQSDVNLFIKIINLSSECLPCSRNVEKQMPVTFNHSIIHGLGLFIC